MGPKKNKKKPFKGGARNTPSNTAGDRCPPSNTWESRNTPSNTAGDRSPPSNTAGDRCPPSNTAGDRRPPSNAWESRNTPSNTAGDRSPPSKTAGDRSPPSITGGDRSPASITGGVSSPPSNTGGDGSPPSNPGESRSTTSNTGGDEKNERYQEICLPTEHSTAGSTRATRSKQDPIHRRVLNSTVRRLIDNLELSGILQHLSKKKIFPDHVLENIKLQQSPPDQIRKLLEVISKSSGSKYAHFLECLSRTKQSHIRKELEDLEKKLLLDKEAMKDVKDIGQRESKCDETKRWDERRQPKDQQFVAKVERSEHPRTRHKHISHESGMVHTNDATLHETEETEDTLVISNKIDNSSMVQIHLPNAKYAQVGKTNTMQVCAEKRPKSKKGTKRKEPVIHNTKERPEEDTTKKPFDSEVAKNKLPTANPSHSTSVTVNINQSSNKAKKLLGAAFQSNMPKKKKTRTKIVKEPLTNFSESTPPEDESFLGESNFPALGSTSVAKVKDVSPISHQNVGGQGAANFFQGSPRIESINVKQPSFNIGQVDTVVLGEGNTIIQPGPSSKETQPCSEVSSTTQPSPDNGTLPKQTQVTHVQTMNVNVNAVSSPAEPVTISVDKQHDFDLLLEKASRFRSGPYILITGEMERQHCHSALSLVPWSFIFNFDTKARSDGLLLQLEDGLVFNNRSLYKFSWQDKGTVNPQSTHWIDLFGSNQIPDTLTEQKFIQWKKKVESGLNTQLNQLSQFANESAPTYVVVVRPAKQTIERHIHFLLDKLYQHMDIRVAILTTTTEDATMKQIREDFGERLSVLNLTPEELCYAVESCLRRESSEVKNNVLPKTIDRGPKNELSNQEVAWLGEYLDVLYEENQFEDRSSSPNALEDACDNFFKGGNLPWHMWYRIGEEHVDVERDIMAKIKEVIKKDFIKIHKSGCIKINHEPGSGGTTLGQRLLWEFRKKIPCAQVKLQMGAPIQEIAQRVERINEKTGEPVLLLIDGEDEDKVKFLISNLGTTQYIILYVKRYPYKSKEPPGCCFYLSGTVSHKEAERFALKFVKQSPDEATRAAIRELKEDVFNKKKRHVFDFGLTAYKHEYIGIQSYVRGFLQIDCNEEQTLKPWQTALVYLSLVHYYGQSSIPVNFFSEMLDLPNRKYKLPEEMQELTVIDANYPSSIRVSHYYIAQEILEHLLPYPQPRLDESSSHLSKLARDALAQAAIGFIQMAGKRMEALPSNRINNLMQNTFISRDNRILEIGEEDETSTKSKRKKVSQILEDMDRGEPHTEMFNVMEKLTESFPNEPHYLAHLGRIFTLYRPIDEESAIDNFRKALALCEEQTRGKTEDEFTFHTRLTLMHVHHMTGTMYARQVAKFTGRNISGTPEIRLQEREFIPKARELLCKVREACSSFENCRKVAPHGQLKDYYFIDEIKVRLQLCHYLHRYCDRDNAKLSKQDPELAKFANESFPTIDYLFLECFSEIDSDDIDDSIQQWEQLFKFLFGGIVPGHVFLEYSDPIQSARFQIAATKLKYYTRSYMGSIHDLVQQPADVHFIINELEKLFVAIRAKRGSLSPRRLDMDYCEWLMAVRHPVVMDNLPTDIVYRRVQQWNETFNTPHSCFYLFILQSLLGFGNHRQAGNLPLLQLAQETKTWLLIQARSVRKPRYPREWFGNGEGIKSLVPNESFCRQIEGRVVPTPLVNSLRMFRGTVRGPYVKPASGYIDLDLVRPDIPFHVGAFFVPVKCEPPMKGISCTGARVEFVLGFSLSHGYEAFNVQRLEKRNCINCKFPAEFTSRDRGRICMSCQRQCRH